MSLFLFMTISWEGAIGNGPMPLVHPNETDRNESVSVLYVDCSRENDLGPELVLIPGWRCSTRANGQVFRKQQCFSENAMLLCA